MGVFVFLFCRHAFGGARDRPSHDCRNPRRRDLSFGRFGRLLWPRHLRALRGRLLAGLAALLLAGAVGAVGVFDGAEPAAPLGPVMAAPGRWAAELERERGREDNDAGGAGGETTL